MQEVYGRVEIVSFYLPIAMLNSLKTIVNKEFDIQSFMTIGGSPCIYQVPNSSHLALFAKKFKILKENNIKIVFNKFL